MKRTEAKEILRNSYFQKMTIQNRLDLLEEFWSGCDDEDWFDKMTLNFTQKKLGKI